MAPPSEFIDAFDIKTVLGALFIGFVVMPGAIYLGLVAGISLGSAAEWTTIILFTEVARRSFTVLRRQEIYLLYYVAAGLTAMAGGLALTGGPFAWLIWNQFLVRSQAARGFGIADQIPRWVAPPPDSPAIKMRTFIHPDWALPIALLVIGQFLSRMNWLGLGYLLYRITSDIERLPFPMAPVAAQGATALAEITEKRETWRWRVFAIGGMIGLVWGAFYAGVPTITGAIMPKPLMLIPIPFIDWTQRTQSILPATPTGLTLDITPILLGFVLPFWTVVGSFAAVICTLVANPILYKMGVLTHWHPGFDAINTQFANSIDFWLSFTIGMGGAVAVIGIFYCIKTFIRPPEVKAEIIRPPTELRGDPGRMWIVALFAWLSSTTGYILLCKWLVPNFPVIFFVIFGFVLTPLISYIDARMLGLTGQWFGIPFIKEATFILSGYKGVDIWFAPIPLFNHGGVAQHLRVVELTGTKLISIIKAEILMLTIILISSFVFWQWIWKTAPIPSHAFPYAQKMWHLFALNQCLWMTATTERRAYILEALKPWVIGGSFGIGIFLYIVFSLLRLPILFIYGFLRGFGQLPHFFVLEIVGACISQFYFVKRFGFRTWKLYATVLLAGYSAGVGLVAMACAAISMIAKSVAQLPY